MVRILAALSLLTFLLNAGAHVATFVDGVTLSQRDTWPLHAATLIPFFAMLGTLMAGTSREGARMARMSREELYHLRDTLQANRPKFFGSVPAWMVALNVALFLYVAGIMLMDAINSHRLEERHGQTGFVVDQAALIEQLSLDERARYEISEVRSFSAVSAIFAFGSFTYFVGRILWKRTSPREVE